MFGDTFLAKFVIEAFTQIWYPIFQYVINKTKLFGMLFDQFTKNLYLQQILIALQQSITLHIHLVVYFAKNVLVAITQIFVSSISIS